MESKKKGTSELIYRTETDSDVENKVMVDRGNGGGINCEIGTGVYLCPCTCVLSHVQLFVTPWNTACQDPLPMEFSRQEYWSGLPLPAPEDLPNPGMEPRSFLSPALAGRLFTTSATWEALQGGTY